MKQSQTKFKQEPWPVQLLMQTSVKTSASSAIVYLHIRQTTRIIYMWKQACLIRLEKCFAMVIRGNKIPQSETDRYFIDQWLVECIQIFGRNITVTITMSVQRKRRQSEDEPENNSSHMFANLFLLFFGSGTFSVPWGFARAGYLHHGSMSKIAVHCLKWHVFKITTCI